MRAALLAVLAVFSSLIIVPLRAADTLPLQLSDATYWKLITDLSEPDGNYPHAVFTGNEPGYQYMLPQLTKRVAPGGTYLGVGPEQNDTYIAALRPKIAFLIDIRRDMMLQHLMYKAIFEMTADRSEFVSILFSRKRPTQLTPDSSVEDIFRAYAAVPPDSRLLEERLKDILARLRTTHGFALSDNDERRLRYIYQVFANAGVVTFLSSQESPGYTRNMTSTDAEGRNWSYLASNENYNRMRAMHEKNLIVPLVGDFTGPRTLRMVGQYLRDHDAIVNVFYVSNVEDYIQQTWAGYGRNIASLPIDRSSLFIRWTISGEPPWLASIEGFLQSGNAR